MIDNRSESIIDNHVLNRKIVYAINKAISDDVPQEIRENRLETNNRHIFAAGDYINDNLRKHVVKDEVELLAFNRYAWEGRILIDRANRVTYTISTHQTLRNIIRKIEIDRITYSPFCMRKIVIVKVYPSNFPLEIYIQILWVRLLMRKN